MLSKFRLKSKTPLYAFFRLNDKEYSLALEKYPELADYDHGIIYEKNSATASIILGSDNYFNNELILL